jgi:FkbM family methyltransferase
MNAQLIYDVGAHLGEDTDFYLRKGFNVVAIEASPVLAERLRQRFRSSLSDGTLSLIEAAVAENSGEIDFYVNRSNSVWGTIRPEWAERNARFGNPSELVKIRAITFSEVLTRYGVPYYLKIDVEGADLLCLEGLMVQPDRPRFVSIESEKRSWKALLYEFEAFKKLGYTRFKIVDQTRIHLQDPPVPAAEGCYADYRHEPGSSGLFGDELPGKWLTMRQAIRHYRLIFFRYRLFGDFGLLRFLLRLPGLRRIFKPAPWYDTHATI